MLVEEANIVCGTMEKYGVSDLLGNKGDFFKEVILEVNSEV